MRLIKKEAGTLLICILGIGAVAYGTLKQQNTIFVFGLLLIIVGYLFIRKELKKSAEDM